VATQKQKVKVGVFLIACLVLIVGGAMLIKGMYHDPGEEYTLEFDESVLGLYEGGLVEYLGVPVGKVRNIRVTESQKALVEILINPEKVTLRKGVEGQLVLYSIAAGTMAISLSGGESDGPVLPGRSRIPTKTSTIEAISSQITDIMAQVSDIADKVSKRLDAVPEEDVREIVGQVKTLLKKGEGVMDEGTKLATETTETVKALREDARRVVDALEARSADLQSLAKEMEALVKTANEKMGAVDVADTQTRIQDALDAVTSLAASVEASMKQLDTVTKDVLHETDNVEHSLRSTMKELTEAFESLRLLMDQLKADPSQLVRGKSVFRQAPK